MKIRTKLLGLLFTCNLLHGAVAHAKLLTHEEKAVRLAMKKEAYGGVAFMTAEKIEKGEAEPVIGINLKDSLFIHWIIPASEVPNLESKLNLPQGFKLAPITTLEGGSKEYYLTLRLHEWEEAQPHYRAEWSVYVTNGASSAPRLMTLAILTNRSFFDPALGEVSAAPTFDYKRSNDSLHAHIAGDGKFLTVDVSLTEPVKYTKAPKEWIRTYDEMYRLNGVLDRVYYNGTLIDAAFRSIDPSLVKISTQEEALSFVKSTKPAMVHYCKETIELSVMPWNNLSEDSLILPPELKKQLQSVKAQAFAGQFRVSGVNIMQGLEESMANFRVELAPAAYFANFVIPDDKIQMLEEEVLPKGFKLAKMSMIRGGEERYMMTLNVYAASGLAPGLRAEWSVYVTREGYSKQKFFMIIDIAADGKSLDPVNLWTEPAEHFTYDVSPSGYANNNYVEAGKSFSLAFQIPPEEEFVYNLNTKWVQANDEVYWSNGIYDRLFYNGEVLDTFIALAPTDSIGISNNTPMAKYIETKPFEVVIFKEKQDYQIRAWYNVEEIVPQN